MSEIRKILEAYNASDNRDPEFDGWMIDVKSALGASDEDIIKILEEMSKLGDALPTVFASNSNPIQLFKKADQAILVENVKDLLDSLNYYIGQQDAVATQQVADKLKGYASSSDVNFRSALHEAIESKRQPTETIDNMPGLKELKQSDPSAFGEISKAHDAGQKGLFVKPSAVTFSSAPGNVNEVSDLVKELKKPRPDPAALARFEEIARARVALRGKDAELARLLAETVPEHQMRELVAKLNLKVEDQKFLIDNFLHNKNVRLPELIKKQDSFLSLISNAFRNKSLTSMERLSQLAKAGGKPAGTVMKLVKMLWKLPGIGKPLALLGLPIAGIAGISKVYDFFAGDDEKPAQAAEGATASETGPSTLTSDLALTGNLHQNMRTILKRTFGPR